MTRRWVARMSSEAQEVEAEVIDVPEVISGADRWLAVQRAKVAEIAGEYVPHEITTGDDYRDSKRARSQARKEIKAVEDARREQVGAIKDAVRDFESQVRDLLLPLKDVDAGYKEALDGWEGMVIESRTDSVQAWYEETQGDVATLVPFATLWKRYADAGKWGLFGTNEVAIQEGVAQAVTTVQGELDTIRRAPYEDEDRKALMAEYLRTLDLSAALRDAEDARQRRERMAAVERDRAEREIQVMGQHPETTPTIDTHSVMTPEQVAEFLHATPATSDEPRATYSFIMPAQTVGGFDATARDEVVRFFKAHGFRGSIHKEEQ